MGRRKRTKTLFEESARLNNLTYYLYLDTLTELAISSIGYENLPETVDPRFLELSLFRNGNAIYFRDDIIGDLCLEVLPSGNFDVYGNPVRRRAFSSYNNYQMELLPSNSVIIWNNYLRKNSTLTIELYARRLAELDRTIEVNCIAQKTPVLIKCSEEQRLTLMNLYKEYSGNAPFIFGDNSLNTDNMQAFSTKAEYVSDKLFTVKQLIWNEALTYLGIANVEVTKKERLISDEVNRNMGGTFACRFSRLNSRIDGFDKVNRMFGSNIKPFFREFNPEETSLPGLTTEDNEQRFEKEEEGGSSI